MHLESVEIENFRGIEYLKLDFRDELGRVKPVLSIVGPNTTEKTSISKGDWPTGQHQHWIHLPQRLPHHRRPPGIRL